MSKRFESIDVWTAATGRLEDLFTSFPKVYVSFSGGKDSGVLLHLAVEAARKAGTLPLPVLFIDLEAQYAHTIDYVEKMLASNEIEPYWVCLPLHLRNAVSQLQPHWMCWDPDQKESWVRPLPTAKGVISDEGFFPFFRRGMEFEEFVVEFGRWFSGGVRTACLVGIRSDESLNRFRTIRNERKETWEGHSWTTRLEGTEVYNAYPLYDWRTEDIWIANGRHNLSYNRIYDLMQLAGLGIHQMRICQPYGDDQRRGLWLYKVLEPETWSKVVNRVAGANFGSRYVKNQGRVLGNGKVLLPAGHTYKSFSKLLLNTMPPHLAAHYREKIVKFLKWWRKHRKEYNLKRIPDIADSKLESRGKMPSWRRICKVLLKNDYWCRGLSFSQTKRDLEKQARMIEQYANL